MKIYIAGHNQAYARDVADILKGRGHEITSTWLSVDMKAEGKLSLPKQREIANKDLREISESTLVVFLSGKYKVPGGKFVEAGYAMAKDIPIVLIGRFENLMMVANGVFQYDTIDDWLQPMWGFKEW